MVNFKRNARQMTRRSMAARRSKRATSEKKGRGLARVQRGKKYSDTEWAGGTGEVTPEQLQLWARSDTRYVEEEKLHELAIHAGTDLLFKARGPGIQCVFDFIDCAVHVTEWLQNKLSIIGLKFNITGYSPVAASHSIPELIKSSTECYKMNIKLKMLCQRIRVTESKTTISKSTKTPCDGA